MRIIVPLSVVVHCRHFNIAFIIIVHINFAVLTCNDYVLLTRTC
jgi:hypothetical protein